MVQYNTVQHSTVQYSTVGANYSQNLTWNHHLEHGDKALLPEIWKVLGGLKFISNQIPASSRIMSKVHYVMALWGGTNNKNIRKVQASINRVARWATKHWKKCENHGTNENMWLAVHQINGGNHLPSCPMEGEVEGCTKTDTGTNNSRPRAQDNYQKTMTTNL